MVNLKIQNSAYHIIEWALNVDGVNVFEGNHVGILEASDETKTVNLWALSEALELNPNHLKEIDCTKNYWCSLITSYHTPCIEPHQTFGTSKYCGCKMRWDDSLRIINKN